MRKPRRPSRKIRSTSFAAELTPAQRDELFTALTDGLSYKEGAARVHEWLQENAATRRLGFGIVHRVRSPATSAICGWYRSVSAAQRYAAVQAAARPAPSAAPTHGDGLAAAKLAALERDALAREQLALDRQKLVLDTCQQRCLLLLDRAQLLLSGVRFDAAGAGESAELQRQIDLARAEIASVQRRET